MVCKSKNIVASSVGWTRTTWQPKSINNITYETRASMQYNAIHRSHQVWISRAARNWRRFLEILARYVLFPSSSHANQQTCLSDIGKTCSLQSWAFWSIKLSPLKNNHGYQTNTLFSFLNSTCSILFELVVSTHLKKYESKWIIFPK